MQASVTCSVTGKLVIPDLSSISGKEGNEVFSERKGNLFNILQNKVCCCRAFMLTQELHTVQLKIS